MALIKVKEKGNRRNDWSACETEGGVSQFGWCGKHDNLKGTMDSRRGKAIVKKKVL